MSVGGPSGGAGLGDASIRTFLIADVRGYTLFTQTRGDEAAAKLAARFAEVVREGVERRDGSVVELRGDEALCVFASARQAIRAAVELQDRLLEETVSDPELPLPVGIGLDAGEAVPVEGGYRGGALNLAARLCGQAKAGEILASREVVHLARLVEGVRYQEQGNLSLKNLPEPVAVVRVISEVGDPAVALASYAPPAPPPPLAPPQRRQRRTVLVATAAVIALIAVGIPLVRSLLESDPIAIETNSLVSIGQDGRVEASVPLGTRPGAVAADEDAVWVARPEEGRVSRLDPETGAVTTTVRVGPDPSAVAVGEGFVWVTNAGGPTVSQISPDTNEVVATIDACSGPIGVATGFGAVWVVCAFDAAVLRVELGSGRTEEVPLPGTPAGIAIGEGSVWVSIATSASVVRLDPDALEVVSEIEVGNGPEAVVVAFGSVWVANRLDGTVDRLDPETGTRRVTIDVGRDPSALATTGDTVWAAMGSEGTAAGIDPGSNRIVRSVDLDRTAGALAANSDQIWATAGVALSDHRGGTLRVVMYPADTLDPAFAYGVESWQLLSMTNDGLVGFRRLGGIGGTTLVPDLALTLPSPADRGTTYRFQLRPGIRYSTGASVEPGDIRFAIERVLGLRTNGAGYYRGLVGADRCSGPDHCDLSEGIVVDDETNTITFHLKRPDPDFRYKLALPFAFAVPQDTPFRNMGSTPLPATGPYEISSVEDEELTLDRNPEFRPWNSPARPDGYPDRIVVSVSNLPSEAVDRVLDGTTDWTQGEPSAEAIPSISTTHASQIHPTLTTTAWFMVLNTTKAPFDDVRIRRAVNLAVDRDRIARIYGPTGRSSCQILPPNFPGFGPYCPFSIDPGPTWDGPDMEAARSLIADAGAAGSRVEILSFAELPSGDALSRYFAGLLRSLGLESAVRAARDIDAYFTALSTHRVQMALGPWAPDYPAPSGVIAPQFRCDGGANWSGFCDQRLDAAMDRASRLQLADPAEAGHLWANIDHDLVDSAAYVPLVNRLTFGLVSSNVGNFQYHPQWGVLLDQLWVV
jgi:peptide/nickel transport system substrate-binding protein